MVHLPLFDELIVSAVGISLLERQDSMVDAYDRLARADHVDNDLVVLTLELVLPVRVALLFFDANEGAEHHYHLDVAVPHHLPEVRDGSARTGLELALGVLRDGAIVLGRGARNERRPLLLGRLDQ